ncbi:MAG: hypothetical protein Q9178_005697 [Gyalolechia marmorata]
MGWLWSSSKADEAANTPQLIEERPTDSAPAPHSHYSTADAASTRDDSPDAEVLALLSSLETTPKPSGTPKRTLPGQTESSPPSSQSSDTITPSHLLPSTMSCRTAFDSAFYCQSLGGQFMNVYRYGNLRDCREQWSQFWFCMKTNRGFLGDEERENRVREHYRLRELKYKVGPSSEDVWAPRTKMVKGAFQRSLEDDEKAEKSPQSARSFDTV